MRSRHRTLTGICGLLFVFMLTVTDIKADPVVITFDDVDTSAGTQQIAQDRYSSLGVMIFSQSTIPSNPLVGRSPNAPSPPNFVFAPRTSPLGGTGNGGLLVQFGQLSVPITTATDFVSFTVVDTGINTPFHINFWGVDPKDGIYILGFVNGSGTTPVTFSTQNNRIVFFTFGPGPSGSIIGIDNLTFNTPHVQTPEPATIVLLGTGLAGIGALVRKRRKTSREE